jgi:hypothetical protein
VLFVFYQRTRGYRAHRAPGIPCALFIERAASLWQTSGARRREIAKLYLFEFGIYSPIPAVIVREGGRSSIPETSAIEPISRGVLDPRLRGDDEVS